MNLDEEEVRNKLQAVDQQEVQNLLEITKPLISAKAIYKACYIDEKLEDAVIIEGIRLNSRVLRRNLEKVGRVFPHIITIGAKLEENVKVCTDLLEKYIIDTIGNIALIKARKYLEDHLCSKFGLDGLSYMSPGSLVDWPIEEQRPLFLLLEGVGESIDVRLTESLIMLPRKSVSGIFFPSEVTFYSCQLCPREKCEGRKARYNEDLAKGYGLKE